MSEKPLKDGVSNESDEFYNEWQDHHRLAEVKVSARESDGSDTWSSSLPGYDGGLFVAMSTDKTFHFYSLRKLMERAGLK